MIGEDFMPKLMVVYGKGKRNKPFHPTLRLRDTGYSRGQWQEMYFREGVFCGSGTIREINLEQAIAHYFSELRRMGHRQVSE